MKSLTLIAAISAGVEVITGLYWSLINFDILDYERDYARIAQSLSILAWVGIFAFFIGLYQKQTK